MSDDPSDVELDNPTAAQPDAALPVTLAPPRRTPLGVIIGAAGLVLALGLAFLYFPRQPEAPAGGPPAQPATAAGSGAETGVQPPLPPLDETDPLVRQLVGQLSSHPAVAAWLTTDGLVLNFAVVTRRISAGENPMQELKALGTIPPFRARGERFIDASSYRRYDRYAQAISALDARGAAGVYTRLKPRIIDAYRRLGEPAGDFDPVLERAITELLSVPVVHGDVELVPHGIGYAFADPKLEELSPAQKQLLRMGPQNVEAIQAKLREIADFLGFPVARLPRPSVLTLPQ